MSDSTWEPKTGDDAVRVMQTAVDDARALLAGSSNEDELANSAYRLFRFALFTRNMTDDQVQQVTERIIEDFGIAEALDRMPEDN